MTASKSMPSPATPPMSDMDMKAPDQSELVDRLATEMRVKSGGELPHSFCVEQVKRQLAGKAAGQPSSGSQNIPPAAQTASRNGSVFHSWALPD